MYEGIFPRPFMLTEVGGHATVCIKSIHVTSTEDYGIRLCNEIISRCVPFTLTEGVCCLRIRLFSILVLPRLCQCLHRVGWWILFAMLHCVIGLLAGFFQCLRVYVDGRIWPCRIVSWDYFQVILFHPWCYVWVQAESLALCLDRTGWSLLLLMTTITASIIPDSTLWVLNEVPLSAIFL